MVVPHTHKYHPPKFEPNSKHHDGDLIFAHFARAACCLLACCLLAAKDRSTLDTKEGYKAKTGSTTSVTLILTLVTYVVIVEGHGGALHLFSRK